MTRSAWVYEPVPAYMGREVYFVVVTTGRMRYIAWIENGVFVTRIGDQLHVFDNIACWMPLPELPNKGINGNGISPESA
jgi:hypothetical protein